MTRHTAQTVAASTLQTTTPQPFKRLLLVALAVGCIGVGIDLLQGPPASSLPLAAAPVAAFTSMPTTLADEAALEPGASVAAYGTLAEDLVAQRFVPAAQPVPVIDAQEAGASVAAYGS